MRLTEFDDSSKFDFEILYQKAKLKISEYKEEFKKLLNTGEITENQFEEYVNNRLKTDDLI